MSTDFDVIIIGAGAAGMMCAIQAGQRGRKVWLLDHAEKLGEKIRISGGGRCNFTNINTAPDRFISDNQHFCKSALKQYTQQDFIEWVKAHNIAFHEKTLGQLFCDGKAQQIIDMLLQNCQKARVKISKQTTVQDIEALNTGGYEVTANDEIYKCESLVVATGGLSIPKIGASKFGYDVARQFGLKVIETAPALVPLTFQADILELCKNLAGVSVADVTVSANGTSFKEALLFTHRGLSGPAILQISSYWREGEEIEINLLPKTDAMEFFKQRREENPKQDIQTALSHLLPARLAAQICALLGMKGKLAEMGNKQLQSVAEFVHHWRVKPSGTEGYRTAEVTRGGVDTSELSSKTMEARKQPGLYFIGEVVDVTGHLGGFNFQWAWSSGYVAGQNV